MTRNHEYLVSSFGDDVPILNAGFTSPSEACCGLTGLEELALIGRLSGLDDRTGLELELRVGPLKPKTSEHYSRLLTLLY